MASGNAGASLSPRAVVVPPPGAGSTTDSRWPIRRSTTASSGPTTAWSGVTAPDTTDSPNPGLDSTTTRSRAPVTGCAVNITPAHSAWTMACTTTAIATAWSGMPSLER